MKMPMDWHVRCLNNRKKSLAHAEAELKRMNDNVNTMKSSIAAYEYQINLAIEKKKDGFDSDKFGKKVSAN